MRGIAVRLAVIGAIALGAFVLRDRIAGGAGDLRVGDCFDVPGTEIVQEVQHHPCAEAHDAEVIFVGDYPAGDDAPAPSLSEYDTFVTHSCESVGIAYVGGMEAIQQTNLTIGFFYPDPEGWEGGDREVICYLADFDGTKLTQSLKAA